MRHTNQLVMMRMHWFNEELTSSDYTAVSQQGKAETSKSSLIVTMG